MPIYVITAPGSAVGAEVRDAVGAVVGMVQGVSSEVNDRNQLESLRVVFEIPEPVAPAPKKKGA